jgi:hypothetical protein
MRAIRSVFLAFLGACCLYLGAPGVYTWVTNPQPTRMSCAEYLAQRPSARWIELTGCDVRYLLAACLAHSDSSTVEGFYAPVQPAGERPDDADKSVPIVLKVADPGVLASLTKLHSALNVSDSNTADRMVIENAEKLFQKSTDIRGLVLAGADDHPAVRAALVSPQNPWHPVDGFVLLEAGRAPSLSPGIFWVLGALVAFGMMGLLIWDGFRRKASATQPPNSPPEPAAPSTPPAAPPSPPAA